MSLNYNRVMIAGNLTRDPQVRFFANERAVANFGLAINRRFKGADGAMQEETTFVDVEAWGRTAELVGQYLTKGKPCFIEGRLKYDTWEDKDGQKRNRLKVVADSVQFTEPRARGAGQPGEGGPAPEAGEPSAPASGPAPAARPAAPPPGDDEPPF
jgi:single-strand DNA-binding protein